ncbi:hypothetical protein ACIQ2O_01200 [Serratia grimesii]|uniref:hypothetical protein n=1 Tax=Serratia grimesii TaxID=82995 RepID=UPI00383A1405
MSITAGCQFSACSAAIRQKASVSGEAVRHASAALWLASKEASFVTGTITSINGGARVG